MLIILIVILWIAALYYINVFYRKQQSIPTVKVPKHKPEDIERVRITLKELSALWEQKINGNKKYSVKLDELVPIYRPSVKSKMKPIDLNLTNKRLRDFYNDYIRGNKSFTKSLMVFTVELVKFLDANGDCPSVVKVSKLDKSKSEFFLLSNISLIDHSIDVAEEMIKFYTSPLAIPDAVVVSLSHDLGKIPKFHEDFYSTGDHPDLSARIIRNEILSFQGLEESQQKEIENAIRMHHKSPKEDLAITLIKADQEARKKEVQSLQDKLYREGKNRNELKPAGQEPIASEPIQTVSVYDANQEKPAYTKPKDVDLSWFSVEEFISKIRPYINKIENGNRFSAISMSNGYVYFMTGLLTDTVVEMGIKVGNSHCQAIKSETDSAKKKELGHELLNSVVNILRDRGMIAENLCNKKYFGNKFTLKYKEPVSGKAEQNAFYTPFLSSAFVVQVSELEQDKPDVIRNIESVERVFFNKES